jgi:hypothetical protein
MQAKSRLNCPISGDRIHAHLNWPRSIFFKLRLLPLRHFTPSHLVRRSDVQLQARMITNSVNKDVYMLQKWQSGHPDCNSTFVPISYIFPAYQSLPESIEIVNIGPPATRTRSSSTCGGRPCPRWSSPSPSCSSSRSSLSRSLASSNLQEGLRFFVCLFPPVALRHRNKDPAPFRHPVDVSLSFCSIVQQHFARHCRQLRSAYFYAPIT